MPCTIAIDPSRQVVFTTSIGLVTDSDLIGVLAVMRASKAFHPDMRCLSDYTRATELRVTPVTLATLATAHPFSARSRRAFLVRDGAVAATVEQYRTQAVGQVCVFTEREQALAWLNEGAKLVQALT